jgi:transposase
MHPPSVRQMVRCARRAGLSAALIQRLTGVPPRSQRRIAQEEDFGTMAAAEFRECPHEFRETDRPASARRPPGRPTQLAATVRQQIDACLAEDPAMKGAEVLRRLRTEHGYQAGKNPVYRYLQQVRPAPPPPAPIVRFEGLPGEFAQHDFGTLTVAYTDGTTEKLTFYAGRLKYSRALHVCLVENEGTEAFLRGLEAFAEALGGLPLLNVIDNAKTAVIRRARDPESGQERIHYNEQFAAFLAAVGVLAEPTAPYAGQQKGAVENLIRFVKEGFLLARHFRDRADLEAQLAQWLAHVNTARPCDATGIIPAVRRAAEQPYLRRLPFGAGGFGLTFTALVRRDGRVRWGGMAYSAPPAWIGQTVTVTVHREAVVLHYQGQAVRHPRRPENGRYSLLPEHREALLVKPRGAVMAKRQIVLDACPAAAAFFTDLVHRRPQTWRQHDLPIVWALFEAWGARKLDEALARCVAAGTIGGEYLQAQQLGVAA